MSEQPEPHRVWEGVYASFDEIPYAQSVFEEEIWAEKVTARADALLRDAHSAGALSPATRTTEYALPFVAASIAPTDRPLRVLDFGGGLGTSYVPLRAMLPPDLALRFVVVENAAVCALGERTFANDGEIVFCRDIPEESFDIVHAGSSLQYVDDWRGMLARLASTGAEYLLIADLPAGDIRSFVTAQFFHGRRIPVRFWNLGEFVSAVEATGFALVLKSVYSGYYLQRGESLPTSHFDPEHQLESSCQLVFRRRPGR